MIAKTATRKPQVHKPDRLRLAGAMTVSLLAHALLLSLQFGLPGIGLPTLELPWRERRAQAVDLQVVLIPPASGASTTPAAPPPAIATAPVTSPTVTGLRLVPPATRKAAAKRAKAKPPTIRRPPRPRVKQETPVIALNEARDGSFDMPAPALDEILPVPETANGAPPQPLAVPAEPAQDEVPLEKESKPAAVAPAEEAQTSLEAEEREALHQAEETARLEEEARAAAQEQIEAARRQEEETARRLVLEREERRKAEEATNAAAALALQRQQEEAARRALALEEQQRAEALRLRAERIEREQREAMELQARKQKEAATEADAAAAQAGSTASAARRDPELMLGDSPAGNARIDVLPRNLTGGGLAGRALEQARRTDFLRGNPPVRQADSSMSIPRRRSIFGSKDVDVGLRMYMESWRLKIERNGSINFPRTAVEMAKGNPVVTVAVRSDGSVEEVLIHRSSGRPELDEAVHRIVRINARYSAFPPELARRYDVIEIRRVWNFDDRLRILEEVQ